MARATKAEEIETQSNGQSKDSTPLIYQKMADVMNDVQAIVKTKQGEVSYKFRSIEDVMNAVHPILSKHSVFIVPEVINLVNNTYTQPGYKPNTTRNQFQAVLTMGYRVYAVDGSSVYGSMAAEATDYSDKATQQASSYCYKDFICKTWCIPTVDVQNDGDGTQPNRDNTAPAEPVKPKAQQPTAQPAPAMQQPLPTVDEVHDKAKENAKVQIEKANVVAGENMQAAERVQEEINSQPDDIMPEAGWDSVRDLLKGLGKDGKDLDATEFHQWTVKTLRANNLIVPDNLVTLSKTAGGKLWQVAKASQKAKQLMREVPAE